MTLDPDRDPTCPHCGRHHDAATCRYARDPERAALPDCGRCQRCRPKGPHTFDVMVLCATCGNKRCPHATDCRYQCSGSNDTDQLFVPIGFVPAEVGR